MTERRRFSRPRTKVYDANYSLGENYYKSAIDGLDRKYGKLPTETLEAPRRPVSVGDLDTLVSSPVHAGRSDPLQDAMDEEMASTLKRIQKARMAAVPSAEEGFENAFFNRREEVKKRYAEKMLESVGLNGSLLEHTEMTRRRKPVDFDVPDGPKVRGMPLSMIKKIAVSEKWTAMRDASLDAFDETAAKARARASKARLADLDAEMEQLEERGAARQKRLANLRQLLDEASVDSSSSSSVRLRKKLTTTTTTMEKRML
ncbi:uncharacterized protein LOC106673921 isoform X2 [Cimex lectularius]|nr:uncharacterized protein LOC106673921 isoform X2 [Cimex lectularius]